MEITEVRIFLIDRDPLKAILSITICDCFVIRDLKIIRGSKGHFVEMPTKWRKDQRFEMASAFTAEARKMLENSIFAEYEKLIGEPVTRRKLET